MHIIIVFGITHNYKAIESSTVTMIIVNVFKE